MRSVPRRMLLDQITGDCLSGPCSGQLPVCSRNADQGHVANQGHALGSCRFFRRAPITAMLPIRAMLWAFAGFSAERRSGPCGQSGPCSRQLPVFRGAPITAMPPIRAMLWAFAGFCAERRTRPCSQSGPCSGQLPVFPRSCQSGACSGPCCQSGPCYQGHAANQGHALGSCRFFRGAPITAMLPMRAMLWAVAGLSAERRPGPCSQSGPRSGQFPVFPVSASQCYAQGFCRLLCEVVALILDFALRRCVLHQVVRFLFGLLAGFILLLLGFGLG